MCEMHNNINYRQMMDYMGEFPPPEKRHAIREIVNIISNKYNSNNKDNIKISEQFINNIVGKVYDEYHVNITRYSYAGWSVFVKNEIISKTSNELNLFLNKRYKIKCGFRAGVKLISIYKDYLERSLAPGGGGYLKAKKEFMFYI